MAQHMPWLDGKTLWDIDSRLIADIIRARTAKASNATIKRSRGPVVRLELCH
jgi:hypothetical protein